MYEPGGSSEGCLEDSLEQTENSRSTPRTCKNRCDINIIYLIYNELNTLIIQ